MRIIVALLFAIIASHASAKGVAYFEERLGSGSMVVLLSDQVKPQKECGFDGQHGYLGSVAIRNWQGDTVDEHIGCWLYFDKEVLFSAVYMGEWKYWAFPIDNFTPL